MPIYSFQVDVNVPPRIVAERLRAVVSEPPTLLQSFRMPWSSRDPDTPPFIGTVGDESFRIRRDIRSRNSFLPRVWGRMVATPTGTQVKVTMFIHPLVAVFMTFWLGMVGRGMLTENSAFPFLAGMFTFGVALIAWGFFPEAAKARRLITDAVLNSAITTVQAQATYDGWR